MLPTEMHALIEIVRNSNPTSAALQLCDEVVKILPQSRTGRGKICSGCRFKMFNRCIKCPQCNLPVAVQRYRPPARAPTPPSLRAGCCNSCAEPVTDAEKTVLSCNHLYHTTCLDTLHTDFPSNFQSTACPAECPNVQIPDVSLGSI